MVVLKDSTVFGPLAGGLIVREIVYRGRTIWVPGGGTGTEPDTEPPGPDGPGAPPDPGDPPAGTFLDTIVCEDAGDLNDALSAATAGDDIVLKNGTYGGGFVLSANGNATNPIRVRAENPQQARINGTFQCVGAHNRLEQLKWDGVTAGNWIVEMTGVNGVVSRCEFLNSKVSSGAQRGLVRIGGYGAQTGRYTQVIYCRFYNFGGRGICVREENLNVKDVRIARSWFKKNFLDGRTGPPVGFGGDKASSMAMILEIRNNVLEYCLFENMNAPLGTGTCGPQCKNSGNVIRYCTLRNAGRGDDASAVPDDPNSFRIELRVARQCQVIGCLMDRASGPLVFGDDHLINGCWNTGNAFASGNWGAQGPARGNCSMDDTAILGAPGGQPRARNCIFRGNKGLFYAGHTSHPLDIQNCALEDHDGTITGPNAGLLIQRAATGSVATPVNLTSADVGVNYGL